MPRVRQRVSQVFAEYEKILESSERELGQQPAPDSERLQQIKNELFTEQARFLILFKEAVGETNFENLSANVQQTHDALILRSKRLDQHPLLKSLIPVVHQPSAPPRQKPLLQVFGRSAQTGPMERDAGNSRSRRKNL